MSKAWDNFKQAFKEQWETDSRSWSESDCFFWLGVIFIAVCIVCLALRIADLVS